MPPKWRHLVDDSTQTSDAATYKLTLPNRGALHALLIKVRCTNGATAGRGVSILDALDNIEIFGDGTEVLFSLIPEEVEKWHETLFGRALSLVQNEAAAGVQEGVFPVLFGRDFYDPNFYLPLERFNDVELQLAYSPTISATVGFATGTFSVDVMALITPAGEAPSYQGSLVTRRIKNFTSAASGDEYSELHSGALYRAIGVYCYEAAVADGTNVTRIQLEDTAAGENLFDAGWDDFIHINRELFGAMIEHYFHLFMSDTDTIDSRIGEILSYAVEIQEDVSVANDTFEIDQVDTIAGDRLTFNSAQADITAGSETFTAYTTDHDIFLVVRGKSPSYFGLIPFIYNDEPAGYLNSGDYGKLEVILTQGNAGADVRIAVQELRNF